jgi:hypothetical protein
MPVTRAEFEEMRRQIADLHRLYLEFLPVLRSLLGGNGNGPNYLALATARRKVKRGG